MHNKTCTICWKSDNQFQRNCIDKLKHWIIQHIKGSNFCENQWNRTFWNAEVDLLIISHLEVWRKFSVQYLRNCTDKLNTRWVIFHAFVVICYPFFLKKIFQEYYQCQMVWIQIRTNMSVLICVQTVCKSYEQMTKVTTSKERLKYWKFNI